ncbi:MAG TPA: CHAT domain-containing tetratricopeptide repeat protein, partial [Candidatus Angelobacter sp.]|nr:CHAT domain-containing tetratricopeptide repeat protein [Candidatus Angelobacter sp.]
MFSITGCKDNRASLEKQYAEARLLFQQGYIEQPLPLAEAGFKESANYPDLNWEFRILTAEARYRNKRYHAALEVLTPEPSSNIASEILWRRRIAQAMSLCKLGKYPETEERFAQAAALHAEPGALDYARGRCAEFHNELKSAENHLRLVAAQSSNPDPFLKAYTLATLGSIALRSLRYDEALDLNKECLAILRSLHAPPLEELVLGNLGSVYVDLSDFNNALEDSEPASKMAAQLNLKHDQQKWLMNIGTAQSIQGKSGMAEKSYNDALAIATELRDNDAIAECLYGLTMIKLDQHQLPAAEKYHLQEAKLGLKEDALRHWQFADASIAVANGNYAKAISSFSEVLQQQEAQNAQQHLFHFKQIWLIQSRLAGAYGAQGNSPEAEKWFQRSIATMDAGIKSLKHPELRIALRDNTPIYDGYVAFLISQKRFAEALQVAQAGRARTLLLNEEKSSAKKPGAGSAKVWLLNVQHYLAGNKSVLLSYFETADECYLWTVTPKELRLSPLGIKGPDLDSLIDSYQREIQQHLSIDDSRAAKKLYQIMVQPAIDLVPKGSHVIVVADSKSYSINFETLVSSPGAEHYWIEDVELENAGSIDLLLASHPRRIPAKGLLLIGAPAQADPHYPVLPHAPEEMASVEKHFPSSKITRFAGSNATPDSYLKNSPGMYKFIHMATHGTPNAIEPLKSAIILSAGKDGKFKLLGQDIINSKVQLNADLVTISACEGAGTQLESLEGLLGLEWAFMRAGAHQVVAALWDQDDAVTPALMDDFYDQLTQGKSTTDALHHAKLSILKAGGSHAAPYYWAS